MLEKLLIQEIKTLTPQQQKEALTLIQNLKTQTLPTPPEPTINNYENFKKIGLIGYCSTNQNLSTSYKKILAEEWSKKYDHR